jgi:peptidoglycan/LPS O-acetylase OafA/YrhL
MAQHAAAPESLKFDKFRLGFRPALDGLRAVAIVAVIATHSVYLWNPLDASRYIPGGFIGVDLFFALSGFLITSLLLGEINRTGKVGFGGFYRRRALRLFPALYALIFVQLIYTVVVGDSLGHDIKGLLYIIFYVSNWAVVFHKTQPFGTQQTWSLGVEEQFYVIWPLLLVAITKIRNRTAAIVPFVVLIGIALVSRELLWHHGIAWNLIYVQTETRFDVLMTGSLMAYLLHTGWKPGAWARRAGYLAIAFLAYVVAFTYVYDGWLFHGGYTLIAIAAAFVVLLGLDDHTPVGRVLAWKPVQELGRRAYSLYIWHYLVILAVVRAWPTGPSLPRLAIGLVLTFGLAELSHRFVEKPFLVIKARLGSDPLTGPHAL